jgi:bifunctional non-homologous end joining protein LigD
VKILHELAPCILTYTKDRNITTIHYPDGVDGKSYYQKNIPAHAPDYISHRVIDGTDHIIINTVESLLWMGNMAALEFHIPFNPINSPDNPDALVFDLDPAEGQPFSQSAEAALIIRQTLDSIGIKSYCKTSGATGLQVSIPLGRKLSYNHARELNLFFARFFTSKYPKVFTIERKVKERGKLLYFDYLQMWKGKTIISPYSPRATRTANISAPVLWEEIEKGLKPEDFTLLNIMSRLKKKGDLYKPVIDSGLDTGIDNLIQSLKIINSN